VIKKLLYTLDELYMKKRISVMTKVLADSILPKGWHYGGHRYQPINPIPENIWTITQPPSARKEQDDTNN